MLIDPAAGGNGILGVAEDDTIADDLTAFGNIAERDFMRLRDGIQRNYAGLCFCALGQVMDGDCHVILLFDLDGKTQLVFHKNTSLFVSRITKKKPEMSPLGGRAASPAGAMMGN